MKALVTPAEAARITGRDPRTIRRWVRGDSVPELGVEIDGRVFIRLTVLERLLGAPAETERTVEGV